MNQSPAHVRRPTQETPYFARVQVMLTLVAFAAIACAVLRAFFPDRFDEKTALFLAIAAVAVVFQRVRKFKFGKDGIDVEIGELVKQAVAEQVPKVVAEEVPKVVAEEAKEVKQEVQDVRDSVNLLVNQVGPGRKSAVTRASLPETVPISAKLLTEESASTWNADPNKGRFGGRSEANGRVVTAAIKPAAGPDSAACHIFVEVKPSAGQPPISGTVELFLHPTFGQWSHYPLDVINGIARDDDIVSYGAFTLGVRISEGDRETLLELDLMTVEGGTERFYAN